MNLAQILTGLVEQIAALQVQMADAEGAAVQLRKEGFDEGFAAGVASVGVPASDKIFSQTEVDAMLAPLNEQILLLKAQLDAVPSQIADAVSVARTELRAEIKARWESSQAAESSAESDFGSFLN